MMVVKRGGGELVYFRRWVGVDLQKNEQEHHTDIGVIGEVGETDKSKAITRALDCDGNKEEAWMGLQDATLSLQPYVDLHLLINVSSLP